MNALKSSVTLACLGIAFGVVASPSVGAVAGIQDDRLMPAPLEAIPDRLDMLKQTRARVARVDIFWNEVAKTRPRNPTNPADPAYDWTRPDMILEGMRARGITPIVAVYSAPGWATGGRVDRNLQFNPHAPRRAVDYANFMQAAATRYSGRYRAPLAPEPAPTPPENGTSTTTTPVEPTPPVTQPNQPLPGVRVWEIWNEPNLWLFFRHNGRPNLGAYLNLVRQSYPRIKRANPRSVVLIGATGPASSSNARAIGARQWLTGIVRSSLNVRFDGYSQHIYPSAAPRNNRTRAFPSWNSLPEMFRLLDQRRDREIAAARGSARTRLKRAPKYKVFITEAGYTTQRTRFRNVQVTPGQQAQYLRDIFRLPAVRSTRVPVVIWFNMQDNPNWPAGLMRYNGSRKPAFRAFLQVSRQGGIPPELRR